MWFRQVQVFKLSTRISYTPETIAQKLEPFAFTSCLPSMPSSMGWVSPLDEEDAALVHGLNGYMMLCLQFEDKILPATVIRQALDEKIKLIESRDAIKVRSKQKLSLKEEMVVTLLPRAFSKFSRVYAYIDTKNQWLVLGSCNQKVTEQFISMINKTIDDGIEALGPNKISGVLTDWLKTQKYSNNFAIEKSVILQDANDQSRVVRCQQQDLFADSIQSLVSDGCEVKQITLSWQDRIKFMLSADDCSLRSLQYMEEIILQTKEVEAETKRQHFDADFFIMTQALAQLLLDLQDALPVGMRSESPSVAA